jgi:hypothetical protein
MLILLHLLLWARLGVKHPGTGEPSIGVRDILMFSMLINLLLLLLLQQRVIQTLPSHLPTTLCTLNRDPPLIFAVPMWEEGEGGGGGGGGFITTDLVLAAGVARVYLQHRNC